MRWRGLRRQNVAREAHGGFKSMLASRLRPLSSKARHPFNYRSFHTRISGIILWVFFVSGMRLRNSWIKFLTYHEVL